MADWFRSLHGRDQIALLGVAWRAGRGAYGGGLENRCGDTMPHRGFESLALRQRSIRVLTCGDAPVYIILVIVSVSGCQRFADRRAPAASDRSASRLKLVKPLVSVGMPGPEGRRRWCGQSVTA